MPATLLIASISAMALIAALVAVRRLMDGLSLPLGWFGLTVAGILWTGASLACRVLWLNWPSTAAAERVEPIIRWSPLVSGAVFAAAILLPGSSLFGASVFVALLVAEEMWSCFRLPWAGPVAKTLADECDQRLTRRRLPSGEEAVEAWLRVRFERGQRTATAHVAFCPPFEHTPSVTFDVASGAPARVKVEQVLPFGARLEVKLPAAAADEDSVVLKLLAGSGAQVQRPSLTLGPVEDVTVRTTDHGPIASAG